MPNKKSLPNKFSLVEVSFEIVLVEISPQHFWWRIYLPKLLGRGVSLETFWWIMSKHFLLHISPQIFCYTFLLEKKNVGALGLYNLWGLGFIKLMGP